MTPDMLNHNFTLSDMTDHEFAAYLRARNGRFDQHIMNATVYVNDDEVVAVVFFDNAAMTRTIYVK